MSNEYQLKIKRNANNFTVVLHPDSIHHFSTLYLPIGLCLEDLSSNPTSIPSTLVVLRKPLIDVSIHSLNFRSTGVCGDRFCLMLLGSQ